MATINYTGPEELTGLIHLFDLEFELLDGTSGRATAASLTAGNAVEMTEQALFNIGYSVNNADVYDVIYLEIDLNYLEVSDSYKSVVVGVTTISG
jgi:hypothetical protein